MIANELSLLKLLFGICLFLQSSFILDFEYASEIWQKPCSSERKTSGHPYRPRDGTSKICFMAFARFLRNGNRVDCQGFPRSAVGKITFHTGARKGWITIQTVSELLEADVLPTLLQSITLHPANTARIICAFTRLRGGIYRFDVKGVGVIESKLSNRFQMTPWFEYRLNDQPIGGSQRIGRWIDRGSLVVLPNDIPLPIQMFILALQRQRA